ncbi:facilitated trehalose transporter Tret1-like isoform X2 [Galleria mellonella]|nr:facilitated trehalose transporter Tret1-like isoform X2 [Galleria mellonella]
MAVAGTMAKCGRRRTNILSSILSFVGWILILFADDVIWIFIGRFLQGISLGLILTSGPVIVGEYTSPKYRGTLLTVISVAISAKTLTMHMMASYLKWRLIAFICTIINFVAVLICLYSPETPSALAHKGKYDDCKKVYRWLRGNDEEQELKDLIKTSTELNQSKHNLVNQTITETVRCKLDNLKMTFKKKEVYKPLIISLHLYMISYWSGMPAISVFPIITVTKIVGTEMNIPMVIMSVDLIRLLSNFLAMYIVKKFKRRLLIYCTAGVNIALLFLIAGYVYLIEKNVIIGKPVIGLILLYVHILSIAIGSLPLPLVISGEIFPLESRSMTSSVSAVLSSLNLFIVLKTFSLLYNNTNIYGVYSLYGVICIYSLVIVALLLPETKDKSLLDIENEFKSKVTRNRDESTDVFL